MSFNCTICNKLYSSYKSLWNHKKKFHQPTSTKHQPNINQTSTKHQPTSTNAHGDLSDTQIVSSVLSAPHQQSIPHSYGCVQTSSDASSQPCDGNKIYYCRKCNKMYNIFQSKWKHEQKCKNEVKQEVNPKEEAKKREMDLKIAKEETRLKKEEIRLKKEEAKILKLKLKLQKSEKVDKITLKKLNSLLLARHNRIQNSIVNSNNNNTTNIQNNNIVNHHYKLVGFDKEHYLNQVLTPQEKRMIVNSKFCSLEKIIEIVHCGKYDQFKNVIITNMKDNYMYKYDDKKGIFVLSNKADVLRMLLEYRLGDLEIIYNELLENNKIDERTKSCIEKFINQINFDNEKIKTDDGKTYDNFRQFKINEIKVLLFNNTDKIMNDVSLLLSTEENTELTEQF